MTRVLILSYGPVPLPEQEAVEGGGLRVWGLAHGLHENNPALDITVAFYEGFSKRDNTDHLDGISVRQWNWDTLPLMIRRCDTVIISYSAGSPTVAVLDNITDNQQLILDGYVPIYIEVSARNSPDLIGEFEAFERDNEIWSRALRRGDVLLCASESQRAFYRGVLAGLGRVNPATYADDSLIEVVPYGIYRDRPVAADTPVRHMLTNPSAFKLLWFGGIYPWFDLSDLIRAVKIASQSVAIELVMVGVRNPFTINPDFLAKYKEVTDAISNEEVDDIVHMADWVPFDQRADWYLDSNAVILINRPGLENTLAWRTRLVDYVWADLPVITNGGDPLSQMLEDTDAVCAVRNTDADSLAQELLSLVNDPLRLAQVARNMATVRDQLYWDVVTKPLTSLISDGYRPGDRLMGTNRCGIVAVPRRYPLKAIDQAVRARRYARQYGLRRTLRRVAGKTLRKSAQVLRATTTRVDGRRADTSPRIVIISHQLDLSGAPFVAVDLALDMVRRFPKVAPRIRFISFRPVDYYNVARLRAIGISVDIYPDPFQPIGFNRGDVVILNSFAVNRNVVMPVFDALKQGRVSKVYWYGHEGTPEGFVDGDIRERVRDGLAAGKVKVLSVSEATKREYTKFFDTQQNILKMPFPFHIPSSGVRTLGPEAFGERLDFVLTGSVADARKGQLPVLYAFLDFYDNFFAKDPDKYRDFSLKFVGVEQDNWVVKQLRLSAQGLGQRIHIIPRVAHDRALEYIVDSNVTICYSLEEALGIFVYEGMAVGHPIIRNESAGQEEQLVEGENGLAVRSDDFGGLVRAIETMLNRETTSDESLAKMSAASVRIAEKATRHDFYIVDEICKEFHGAKRPAPSRTPFSYRSRI